MVRTALSRILNVVMTRIPVPDDVRALIGVKRVRRHVVSESEIIRFAQAIGASLPPQGDPIEAPPLFYQALAYEAVPLEQLPDDGSPRELDVPIPATRTVGGSSEFVIHRRARASETITIETSLTDVIPKHGKSGVLYLVVVETRFSDADGILVANEIATFIKRA